jgi:hypothetical protein
LCDSREEVTAVHQDRTQEREAVQKEGLGRNSGDNQLIVSVVEYTSHHYLIIANAMRLVFNS